MKRFKINIHKKNEERKNKLKELRLELVKSKTNPSKSGTKSKQIKKIIARILTLNKQDGNMSKVRLA